MLVKDVDPKVGGVDPIQDLLHLCGAGLLLHAADANDDNFIIHALLDVGESAFFLLL